MTPTVQNCIESIIKTFELDKYAGGTFVPTFNRLYFMEI